MTGGRGMKEGGGERVNDEVMMEEEEGERGKDGRKEGSRPTISHQGDF